MMISKRDFKDKLYNLKDENIQMISLSIIYLAEELERFRRLYEEQLKNKNGRVA